MNDSYKVLLESLRLTALPYEDQQKLLPDFVVIQDEVINELENAFSILPDLVEADLLSNKATASIIRCYNMLETTRREVNLEDPEAFKTDPLWQQVRTLALQSLQNLNESPTPDPNYYNP